MYFFQFICQIIKIAPDYCNTAYYQYCYTIYAVVLFFIRSLSFSHLKETLPLYFSGSKCVLCFMFQIGKRGLEEVHLQQPCITKKKKVDRASISSIPKRKTEAEQLGGSHIKDYEAPPQLKTRSRSSAVKQVKLEGIPDDVDDVQLVGSPPSE